MAFDLLDAIRCSFCAGRFTIQLGSADGFAILTCYCGQYPVVAGIPILKRGTVGTSGETAAEVVGMIGAGRSDDALLAMIMPPPPSDPATTPVWLRRLPPVRGIRRIKRVFEERADSRWRAEVAPLLTNGAGHFTASDIFDLYYHRSGLKWNDAYDYFFLRFGQPRYLVALSFTTIIDEPARPVLDLACGYGHLTRSLARRAGAQPVVGVDENFIGLYVAKKFISPDAEYVCCAGDGPLPFHDDFFSVSFCSDAFHYFLNKAAAVRELERVTVDGGMLIFVWVHNVQVRRPHDGLPLPPEGYQALFAHVPHRITPDSHVLARYLEKRGPALSGGSDATQLAGEAMLSIVACRRPEVFRDYSVFEDWPHAEGRLALNPLYTAHQQPDSDGTVELTRTFPSAFYTEDHAESRDYLPETISLRPHVLAALAEGKRTTEVEQLIGQIVAVGIPDRYSKRAGSF